MKKILAITLALLMILSLFAFAGCDSEEPKETEGTNDETNADSALKLGLGVYTTYDKATDAEEDVDGAASYSTTAAAVLLDANGKVIKCEIDTADIAGAFTAEGKFVSNTSFSTKGELKEAYGMSAAGMTEWYKQVDAFEKLVIGKTASEIAGLMANTGKGNDDVIAAGCTIYVSAFVKALDLAIKNAKDSAAKSADTLKLAMNTTLKGADYNTEEDTPGALEFETTYAAVTLDASAKITACANDCLGITYSFDEEGKLNGEYTGEVKTKGELKEAYGMSAAGMTEWYKQAAAFDAACVGKTASEIAGLMGADYKGIASVQSAGCTIYVSSMVTIVAKAAK